MKTWEVWSEGYWANGNSGKAYLKGAVQAETFREACAMLYRDDPYYNAGRNTWWGCRLYDNEADARRMFG